MKTLKKLSILLILAGIFIIASCAQQVDYDAKMYKITSGKISDGTNEANLEGILYVEVDEATNAKQISLYNYSDSYGFGGRNYIIHQVGKKMYNYDGSEIKGTIKGLGSKKLTVDLTNFYLPPNYYTLSITAEEMK